MASMDFMEQTRCDDNLPCYGDLSGAEILKELSNPSSDESDVEVDEIQECNYNFKKELDAIELLVYNETKSLQSK